MICVLLRLSRFIYYVTLEFQPFLQDFIILYSRKKYFNLCIHHLCLYQLIYLQTCGAEFRLPSGTAQTRQLPQLGKDKAE